MLVSSVSHACPRLSWASVQSHVLREVWLRHHSRNRSRSTQASVLALLLHRQIVMSNAHITEFRYDGFSVGLHGSSFRMRNRRAFMKSSIPLALKPWWKHSFHRRFWSGFWNLGPKSEFWHLLCQPYWIYNCLECHPDGVSSDARKKFSWVHWVLKFNFWTLLRVCFLHPGLVTMIGNQSLEIIVSSM